MSPSTCQLLQDTCMAGGPAPPGPSVGPRHPGGGGTAGNPAVLKQGDHSRAGQRPRNHDHPAPGRWSKRYLVRAWSCCPPGCGRCLRARSPCIRLCLNGGSLQPEPICKFGRFAGCLNIPARICDVNPFLRKTIHGRADNVMPIRAHAKAMPSARTFSSRS